MESSSDTHSSGDAVLTARQDLRQRTLSKIGTPFERLIYLASLRDYRSGRYCHDGLAARFSESVTAEALRFEHLDAFHSVAFCPLQSLVEQLDDFFMEAKHEWADGLRTWHRLEPYRVLAPVIEDGLVIHVFLSNIKFALAILATRQRRTH